MLGTSLNISKSGLRKQSLCLSKNELHKSVDYSHGEISNQPTKTTTEETIIEQFFIDEDREKGSISCGVLNTFCNMVGGKLFLFGWLVLISFGPILRIYRNAYLLDWSKDLNVEDKWNKYTIWAILANLWVFSSAIKRFPIFYSLHVTRTIHAKMISRVFHSRVHEFLEKVPLGRIINRFANDVYNVDFTTLAELIVFSGYALMVFLDLVVTVKYTTWYSVI